MENDTVICRVVLRAVAMPVGGFDVNLNVSGPLGSVSPYLRVEEIRAGVGVKASRIDHLDAASVAVGESAPEHT